jgi:hypothetical protein
MAATTPVMGQENQTSQRSVAKTAAALGTRRAVRVSPPTIPTHPAPPPPTARHLTLARQAATPVLSKSHARALTSAATAPSSSMLHCYNRDSLFTNHSSRITSHCLFNRQARRLETTVTHTKETPATPINRQLSGTLCSANHNSPITNNAPSNRQWQILEFIVTRTKQTPASRSNRQYWHGLNSQLRQSEEFFRTRTSLEGLLATLNFQPSPLVSNRNNASFKIAGNSLKIRAKLNPNRNTKRQFWVTPPIAHCAPITSFVRCNFHAGLGRRIR